MKCFGEMCIISYIQLCSCMLFLCSTLYHYCLLLLLFSNYSINVVLLFLLCLFSCLLLFVFRVFCVFVLLLILYIAVSLLFLHKFTDHCQRVETQLQ